MTEHEAAIDRLVPAQVDDLNDDVEFIPIRADELEALYRDRRRLEFVAAGVRADEGTRRVDFYREIDEMLAAGLIPGRMPARPAPAKRRR
jgi:hypothetical protein